ncbi:MAG: flagellar hook-associated protein FlgL [Sedimentisphaerales bacterium]|nr:flagellar hook-associated protein FlgL [Sedimentisphaerales bacterium]
MSFSLESIYNGAAWAIAVHSSALAKLQEQAATGQEVNRTSDDPYEANRILDLRTESRSMERFVNTVSDVVSMLEFSDSVIRQMSGDQGIAGVLETLTSALSPIYSDQSVQNQKAAQINEILEDIVSLANKQRLSQRLFAGADSDADPYQVTRNSAGEIIRVEYVGSHEEQKVVVAPGVEVSSVLVGDELFRADEVGTPVFYGSTKAAAGSGTSSVRGDVQLTITGTTGAWVLSIDGGATTFTSDGSQTNLPVVNGTTGEVLYVDTTAIDQAGTAYVRVPGTYDIFNILINTRDLLKNVNNLPESIRGEYIDETIASMREVEEKLVRAYPIIGGRITTLNNLQTSLEDIKMNAEEEISRRQDADITQVALDLSRHEVLYEMSLAVSAKMFSLSLTDFIS